MDPEVRGRNLLFEQATGELLKMTKRSSRHSSETEETPQVPDNDRFDVEKYSNPWFTMTEAEREAEQHFYNSMPDGLVVPGVDSPYWTAKGQEREEYVLRRLLHTPGVLLEMLTSEVASRAASEKAKKLEAEYDERRGHVDA